MQMQFQTPTSFPIRNTAGRNVRRRIFLLLFAVIIVLHFTNNCCHAAARHPRWSFYLHVHLTRAFTRIVAYHRPDKIIFYHRLEMDLISSFFCKLNFTNFRIIFGISCTEPRSSLPRNTNFSHPAPWQAALELTVTL